MNNTYYLVRHAHSAYTPDELKRPLSDQGRASLPQLDCLKDKSISAIYSSPYRRAIETVQPLAEALNLPIQTDRRLAERRLSKEPVPDQNFEACLKQLWQQPNSSLPGGESNLDAQARALDLLEELEKKHHDEGIVLSSHGNLICILLSAFDQRVDYDFWASLSMPDVLVLDRDGSISRHHPS